MILIAFSDLCLGDITRYDEEILGASAHSDYGMITLLATDGVPGLQACPNLAESLSIANF